MAKKDNFLKAQEEFDSGTKDTALWTQALALSSGDEGKAKYKYIELRAKEMGKFSFRPIEKEVNGDTFYFFPIFLVTVYTSVLFQATKSHLIGGAYYGQLIGSLLGYYFILYILAMFLAFLISFSEVKLPKKTAWIIVNVLVCVWFTMYLGEYL